MRICFLVNPRSGGGKGRDFVSSLYEIKDNLGLNAFISCIGEDADIAAISSDPSLSHLIVVGGDGTFSSLLPYVLGRKLILGLLPIGTANDLARELGFFRNFKKQNLQEMLRSFLGNKEQQLDVWKFEYGEAFSKSQLFCNYLSIGFDAVVIRDFDAFRMSAKPLKGFAGILRNRYFYARAGLKNLSFSLPPGICICNSETSSHICVAQKSLNLLFPNIHSYMGFAVSALNASPFDGKLPLVISRSLTAYPKALIRRFLKWPDDAEENASGWRILFGPHEVPVQIDGELLQDRVSGEARIVFAGKIGILQSNASPEA